MNILIKKRLRTIAIFLAWGGVIGAGLGMFIGWIDEISLLRAGARGVAVGVLIGAGVGAGEEILLPRWSRTMSFGWLSVLRIVGYTITIVSFLIVVNGADLFFTLGVGIHVGITQYAVGGGLGRDILLAFIAAALTTSFLLVRKLHAPGEIMRLLTGRYHYPEEEVRVFLFADIVDSTGIAERLGHLAFSGFLRSCFSDVSEAILAWRGEVFQYAGDSVIVTWPMSAGVKDGACIQCFFDMIELLDSRRDFYQSQYGTTPRLRAGIHGGEVVTTWVGETRKVLAFHGDTMNTTARLEAKCKELGVQCLTSEVIRNAISLPPNLDMCSVGEVELRGLTEPLKLFSVSQVSVSQV